MGTFAYLEMFPILVARPPAGAGATLMERAKAAAEDLFQAMRPSAAETSRRGMDDAAESLMERITSYGSMDHEANRPAARAAASLADRKAWDMAHAVSKGKHSIDRGTVTLDQHNWAASAAPFLGSLLRTNPGAVTWLFAFCKYPVQDSGPVQHPGQIISTVRDHMRQSGLKDRNWRAAATLPVQVMHMLTAWCKPDAAAAALNLIGAAGSTPSPGTAGAIAFAMNPRNNGAIAFAMNPRNNGAIAFAMDPRNNGAPRAESRNEERVLTLACRESGQHGADSPGDLQVRQNMRDALDYAAAMDAAGTQVRSTRWNGLLKASEKWHREREHARTQSEWEKLVSSLNGRYRAWNTMIPEAGTGGFWEEISREKGFWAEGFWAEALTDERQLNEESLEMDHCVILYGRRCAGGRSRIFSLRKDGQRVATGEIALEEDGWREQQTRGRGNRQADGDAVRAMRKIAALYNRAWEKDDDLTEAEKHRHWYIAASKRTADTDPEG